MEQAESSDLKEIKSFLKREKLDPEHVIEMFVKPGEVEGFKSQINKETNGHCYFFTKDVKDKVHIIAFVNIENISDLFEKIKLSQSQTTISSFLKEEGSAYKEFSFLDDD